MLKISYAGCLGPSVVIWAQFTLEICVAASKHEKITKADIVGIQCRSRSSMLVPSESSQQCLLQYAAGLCLSGTVFLLDWSTVAEIARFEGVPKFGAFVRRTP